MNANESRAEPFRVLMTTDTVGSVWRYSIDLAAALRGQAQVFLAAVGRRATEAQRREADAAGAILIEGGFTLERMDDPWEDAAASRDWIEHLAGEIDPNVVHLNGYAHGDLDANAPVVIVAHSCALSWWRAVHGVNAPPAWQRYRDLVRANLGCADAIVAPSRAMLRAVQHHYAPPPHVAQRVIYNAADSARCAPASYKVPYVFSAGQMWDEARNFDALVTAAPKLRWPLVVAGAVPPESPVDDTPNLAYVGEILSGRVLELMARASIFALPAKYEPFGLTALDAALCGCALVLGDIPSQREIWGDAAVFVDPKDPVELAQDLNDLTRDEDYLRDRAHHARACALSYSVERMRGEYLELYRELMVGGRAPHAAGIVR